MIKQYSETRRMLNNVIKTIDGSQPVDIAGAIAALQTIHGIVNRCQKCGCATMVYDWQGSGDTNRHCLSCDR